MTESLRSDPKGYAQRLVTSDRAMSLHDRIRRSRQPIVVFYEQGKFRSLKESATTGAQIDKHRANIVGIYTDDCPFGWLEADMLEAESTKEKCDAAD